MLSVEAWWFEVKEVSKYYRCNIKWTQSHIIIKVLHFSELLLVKQPRSCDFPILMTGTNILTAVLLTQVSFAINVSLDMIWLHIKQRCSLTFTTANASILGRTNTRRFVPRLSMFDPKSPVCLTSVIVPLHARYASLGPGPLTEVGSGTFQLNSDMVSILCDR